MDNEVLRTILVDGTYDGTIIVEHNRFSGKLIKITRSQADYDYILGDTVNTALDTTGVYILLGLKADGEEAIYIGKSDSIRKRLNEHINYYSKGRKTFYWTAAIVFTREKMDETSLLYLEDRICETIRENKKYACLTTITNQHNVDEYRKNELDRDLEMIKLMYHAVGCDVLSPITVFEKRNITLYCSDDNGTAAKGCCDGKKFIVKKGSVISETVDANLDDNHAKERSRLSSHQNGTIKERTFIKDHTFDNITQATAVVCGRVANGKQSWKTKEGISLKECGKLNVK